jgi:two-component system, OmpR family, sensor kinase
MFFWVTIVVFALTAAIITTVNFMADAAEPQRLARQAQAVLDAGSRPALERWLAAHNRALEASGRQVLILDGAGRDILGQRRPDLRRGFGAGTPPGPPLPGGLEPPGLHPPVDGETSTGQPRPPEMAMRLRPGPPMPPDVPVFPRLSDRDGARYVLMQYPPPSRGPFSPPFSRIALAALLLIALAVSGLVSYAFARSICRPLERLQATARGFAEGDLSARAATRDAARRDEIGVLAREFDAMAARLAALIEARQQLLRDMSHELRSPLARLQMAVGIARQPGADAAHQLERIERESGRLETLIARILEYARLERDPATLARETVDVAELVRRVVHDAEFESQSLPDRITVSIGLGGDEASAQIADADPTVLHTALDNVVRNALLHGGAGPVEVSVASTGSELEVAVRDRGPGVPPRDLARIFEPFYRVATDEPRAAGHGVGLALARRAAELHGGRVVAENAEGGGLRVRILLPRAGRAAGRH